MGKIKEKKYTSNKNGDSIRLLDYEQAKKSVSYTHLRAHETVLDLVCRLLLEKKTTRNTNAY